MFFEFCQNNSGGHFVFDKDLGITHWVFIEALTLDEALSKATSIGIYFDGCASGIDCKCCGDRWYKPITKAQKHHKVPRIDGHTLNKDIFKTFKLTTWMNEGYEACVHYRDGRIDWF